MRMRVCPLALASCRKSALEQGSELDSEVSVGTVSPWLCVLMESLTSPLPRFLILKLANDHNYTSFTEGLWGPPPRTAPWEILYVIVNSSHISLKSDCHFPAMIQIQFSFVFWFLFF